MKIAVVSLVLCLIGTQAVPLERLYHGLEADVTPYHAHLWIHDGAGTSWPGSGVIISQRHVLTVAVNIAKYQYWDVGYGSNKTSGLQVVTSETAFVHEHFSDSSLDNNIGIILLPNDIVFSQSVQKIRLPSLSDDIPSVKEAGEIVAFSYMSDYGPISEVLQYGIQNVITTEECVNFFPYLKSIQSRHFCTSAKDFNVCGGAQGAGFVVKRQKQNVLAGILSFGNLWNGCAVHAPPIFVNIAKYLDWIIPNLNQ